MNGFGHEREISLPLEARPVQAVALIIRNSQGLIYTNEEKETKPEVGKFAGMRSFPMETIEAGESREQTLRRLQNEEVAHNLMTAPPDLLGVYGIGTAALWCYETSVISQNGRNPDYKIAEVGEPGWIPIDDLKNGNVWVREGVVEMATDYSSGIKGARRESCQPAIPALQGLNGKTNYRPG